MRILRRWFWLGFWALSLCAGCNVLSLPYFLMGPEPSKDAELKRLASDDKKKEVKVLILVDSELQMMPELRRVDRDLADLLAKHLREGCKYNEEKVKIVSPVKVEQFKNQHPDWKDLQLEDIAKNFKVNGKSEKDIDYVINIDILSMSLFEKGTGRQYMRGHIDLNLKLVNVQDPDDTMERRFQSRFPDDGKIPIEANTPGDVAIFEQSFLDATAKKLSWFFTAHPSDMERDRD